LISKRSPIAVIAAGGRDFCPPPCPGDSRSAREILGEFWGWVPAISIKLLHARTLVPKNLHTADIRYAAPPRKGAEIKRFRLPPFRSNRVFVFSACANGDDTSFLVKYLSFPFFSACAASPATYAILDTGRDVA
jgi:hypothetical protein